MTRTAVVALLCTLAISAGCGAARHAHSVQEDPTLEAALAATAAAAGPRTLRVRLAFGAGADLDLYLTDLGRRGSETVYFARHESRTGGRLLRDARCGDPTPRIDAAVFDPAPSAGVRIGVDYHAGCHAEAGPVPFVVEVSSDAGREIRHGVARPGHFADDFWRVQPSGQAEVDQYIPNVK